MCTLTSVKPLLKKRCDIIVTTQKCEDMNYKDQRLCEPIPTLFGLTDYPGNVLSKKNLQPSQLEYFKIANRITNHQVVVDRITRIHNRFLEKAYELKKEYYRSRYGDNFTEDLYFHGTSRDNINSICHHNFDWRLFGENTGQHKFGKGVSFTPNAMWATNYGDKGKQRYMLVAKVLVGRSCLGHEDMALPPKGYDTTQQENGAVIVKYDDNEFLPIYQISYHLDDDDDDLSSGDDDYYFY